MIIVLERSQLLFKLFPELLDDESNLQDVLTKFYTLDSQIPKITISENSIIIDLSVRQNIKESTLNEELLNLLEERKLEAALPVAKKLVKEYPNISDNHRILGQIYSELGNQDEAVNSLIEALKWSPVNKWALIMMGNIYAKFKNDIDTAMVYYNQVLTIDTNDNIALNNIGANLMQLGRFKEAKEYLHKAVFSNPDYPNTYLGLALIAKEENDYQNAFEYLIKALSNNKLKDKVLESKAIELSKDLATTLSNDENIIKIISEFGNSISEKFETNIQIEEDDSIPTAAKLELKENYDRDFHLVKYQSKYPAYPHLVIHELIHLELAEEARRLGTNHLFTANKSHKAKFYYSLEKDANRLKKKGIDEERVADFFEALFMGINRQIFNTPIDLFIEDIIFNRFPILKPIQFYSLLTLTVEGIEAVTRKDIVDSTPKSVLKTSKIYNLVNTLHFKNIFGFDLTHKLKATKMELQTAKKFYDEFQEYRKDRQAGEEYELVQHWGEDLKQDGFFDLILESKYRNQTIEKVIDEINIDPLNLQSEDSSNERKMRSFIQEHTNEELNLAVVMHMVSALELVKNMSSEKVKKLSFEFATLGMTGIDPNKNGYSVPSLSDVDFSGYKALAYYYVTWAISAPEMLDQLSMPFQKEYSLAKKFINR